MDVVPDWIKDALGCKVLVLYSVCVQNIHMLDFRTWTRQKVPPPLQSIPQGQDSTVPKDPVPGPRRVAPLVLLCFCRETCQHPSVSEFALRQLRFTKSFPKWFSGTTFTEKFEAPSGF